MYRGRTAVALIFTAIGPSGEYSIERDGYHPQAGMAFLYEDDKYTFYFYVEDKVDMTRWEMTLIVKHASTQRFNMGTPVIGHGDKSIIEQNIERYLTTVSVLRACTHKRAT